MRRKLAEGARTLIKCGVCGSENEAAALFCGTCGSPLSPADAKAIADEAEKTTVAEATPTDGEVVPGKGAARRDLGSGGGRDPGIADVRPPGGTEKVVPEPEPEAGAPTIVCSVCGTVNDTARTYCRKCANELKRADAPPPPPPPPPSGRRISPLMIGLGAAGLVFAVGAIAIFAFGNNGGPPAATPTQAAQVTAGPSTGIATPGATPGATQGTEPTDPPFDEGDPEGRIVFARCVGNTECVIFMINADGSEVGAQTDIDDVGSASDPELSHDGQRVIFTVRAGLRLLDIDSGDVSNHSNGRGDVNGSWSPDDEQVTFAAQRDGDPEPPTDDREIRLDDVTQTGPSKPMTTNSVEDHDPVFTIDGQSIIWVRGEDDQRELRMVNIDSGEITELTSDDFNDVDPAVSPDGTQLVFASTRGSGGEFDLFLLNLTTEEHEITPLPTMEGDEHDPAWSPGGRYIVFSGGEPDSNNLFLLDLADGETSELTSTDERDLAPSWRP